MPASPHRGATSRGLAALRAWLGRDRARQWGCLGVLACVCLPCGARPWPKQQPISLEYQVKATYLYKLAPFVNWPPAEFATPNAPFHICVAGDDPFGSFLHDAVAGRRFGTHPFDVLRLNELRPGASCQIVFISRSQTQETRQLLASMSGRPVLTVIDSGVPQQGGVVQFVIEHGRVGFEIDTGAAARNHITISSKLLDLALAVRDGS
jgi:hypothetical protein